MRKNYTITADSLDQFNKVEGIINNLSTKTREQISNAFVNTVGQNIIMMKPLDRSNYYNLPIGPEAIVTAEGEEGKATITYKKFSLRLPSNTSKKLTFNQHNNNES